MTRSSETCSDTGVSGSSQLRMWALYISVRLKPLDFTFVLHILELDYVCWFYNKFLAIFNFWPESRFLKQDKVEAETALTLKTSMSITIYEMTMMTFRRWHSWLHRSTITTIMQWPAPGHQDNLLGDRYSLPAIQASIQCTQSVFHHTSDNMSNSIYCMSTDWLLMLGWY